MTARQMWLKTLILEWVKHAQAEAAQHRECRMCCDERRLMTLCEACVAQIARKEKAHERA
jgi:hypothetical protein